MKHHRMLKIVKPQHYLVNPLFTADFQIIQSIFDNADEVPGQWVQILLTPLLQDKAQQASVRCNEELLYF